MTRVDPRLALVALVCAGTLAILVNSMIGLGMLCLLGLAVFVASPVPRRPRLLMLVVLAGVVWSNLIGQGFFHISAVRSAWLVLIEPRGEGLLADGLVLTREGVRHGLIQSSRFCALILMGTGVTASLSDERLLQGLSAFHLPPVLAFSLAAALRSVGDLASEWTQIRQAAALRGLGPDRRRPLQTLSRELALLRPLLARGILRSQQLALAARTRGLGLTTTSFGSTAPPMPTTQRIVLTMMVAVTLLICGARLLTWAFAVGLPGAPPWYGLFDVVRRFL